MSYNLGTAQGRIEIDGSGAAKGFQVAGHAAEGFFSVVKEKVASLQTLSTNLMKLGTAGTVGLGLAINSAASFEQRLSAIAAVSGATASEMDKVSEASLRIGAETSFGANEAAQAFEELIKAGISVDDALNGAADAAVAMAEAGEIDVARAAEIAAAAMNNFNMEARDLPGVADAIAGAANASAISVEEFAQSMNQVGAVAALTGLSFDDMSVAIAEMGNAGIKGSDAGTSLKTMLMNLIPTTDKQKDKFEELGLAAFSSEKAIAAMEKQGIKPLGGSLDETRQAVSAYLAETEGIPDNTKEMGKAVDDWLAKNGAMQSAFFDTNGEIKSLREIQDVLATSTKDLTREQKLQALEIMFGADAIRAAAVMADNGAAGFDKLSAAIGSVSAADVAKTRMDNFRGALEEMRGAIETASITIGTYFLPVLKNIFQFIGRVIDIFNSAPESVHKFVAILLGAASVIALLSGAMIALAIAAVPVLVNFLALLALKKVWSIISVGLTALRNGGGVLARFGASAAAMGGRFSVVMKQFGLFGKLVLSMARSIFGGLMMLRGVAAFAFGPWGIAIGLVITALKLLYDRFEPFKNLVDSIGGAVASKFREAWSSALEMVASFIDRAKVAWEGFKQLLAGGGSGALAQALGVSQSGVIMDFFLRIKGAVEGVKAAIQTIKDVWAGVVQVFQGGGTGLLAGALGVEQGAAIVQVFRIIKDAIQNAMSGAVSIFQTVKDAWAGLVQLWQGGGSGLLAKALGVEQSAGIMTAIRNIMNAAKGLWEAFTTQLIPALISFGQTIYTSVMAVLDPLWQMFTGKVLPAVMALVEGILGALIPAFTSVQGSGFLGWIMGIASAIGGLLLAAFNAIFPVLAQFATFFVSTILPAMLKFGEMLMTVLVPVLVFVGKLILDSIMGIVNGVRNVIVGLITIFQGIVTFLTGVFTGQWGMAWEGIKQIFAGAFQAIWGVIQLIWYGTILKGLGIGFNLIRAIFSGGIGFLKSAVSGGFGAIRNTIGNIMKGIWELIKSTWTNLRSGTQQTMSAIGQTIRSIWNTILGTFRSIGTNIQNLVRNIWSSITSNTTSTFTAIKSHISNAWTAIRSTISNALSAIRSHVQNMFRAIGDIVKTTFNNIVNTIRSSLSNASQAVSGGIQRIKGLFSGASGWLVGAGRSIIQGLINGIKAMGSLVSGAVEGIMQKARNLLPFSPAKEGPFSGKGWSLYSGMSIPEALAAGVDKRGDEVRKAVEHMMRSASAAATVDIGTGLPVSGRHLESSTPVAPTEHTTHIEMTVNNPVAEKTSTSVNKSLGRVATLAGV